jgi:alpha-beta hydrolase superfamily lysophospholipase
MNTVKTHFPSGDGRCTAWLTVPAGRGPFPAVVLVHGFGATHVMALSSYERWFSEAGMAVVSFDFRRIGESPGEPRQRIRVKDMLADTDAALSWAQAQTAIDPERVALWGTSLGASHAMVTAARRADVAAVVVNCPMIDGLDAARRLGAAHVLRLAWPIASDAVRSLLGLRPHYVPLVVEPGEYGLMNVGGARAGWYSIIPPAANWDNRVGPLIALDMLTYRAASHADRIRCPFLVCVSDRENLMDPAIAARAAQMAPQGEAIHYPADHFEVYHPPIVERVVADQIRFLRRVLLPEAALQTAASST